jgi:hypothetical protein
MHLFHYNCLGTNKLIPRIKINKLIQAKLIKYIFIAVSYLSWSNGMIKYPAFVISVAIMKVVIQRVC